MIEDCAGFRATYRGQLSEPLAMPAASVSFPAKISVSAYVGWQVTRDNDCLKNQMLRNHGSAVRYYHPMSATTAGSMKSRRAIRVKAAEINASNDARRRNAAPTAAPSKERTSKRLPRDPTAGTCTTSLPSRNAYLGCFMHSTQELPLCRLLSRPASSAGRLSENII